MVQDDPSSNPRHTSKTAPNTSMVTVLCGWFRHEDSLPTHGPLAVPAGSASRSGETLT